MKGGRGTAKTIDPLCGRVPYSVSSKLTEGNWIVFGIYGEG